MLEPHSLPLSLQVRWLLGVSPFLPPISLFLFSSQFGCLESLTKIITIMLSNVWIWAYKLQYIHIKHGLFAFTFFFFFFLINISLILSSHPLTGGTPSLCGNWISLSSGFCKCPWGLAVPWYREVPLFISLVWLPMKQSLSQALWRLQFQWLCCFCFSLGTGGWDGPACSLLGGNSQPCLGKPGTSTWHCPRRTNHLLMLPLPSSFFSGAGQISPSFDNPHLYLLL